MSLEFEGLTEFQKSILDVVESDFPGMMQTVMQKTGNRLNVFAKREARNAVGVVTGKYLKSFKRGKVFKDQEGKFVVRVYNAAPHAHLIEYGVKHKNGGYTPGKLVIQAAGMNFEASGELEKTTSKELDSLLLKRGL